MNKCDSLSENQHSLHLQLWLFNGVAIGITQTIVHDVQRARVSVSVDVLRRNVYRQQIIC